MKSDGLPFIAVMQGRLLPPTGGHIQGFPGPRWREELGLARRAGLCGIEWIFEETTELINPLSTLDGVAEILAAASTAGVAVRSVCADYFMTQPLAGANAIELTERLAALGLLLGRCGRLGASHIVLPFVDQSSIGPAAAPRIVDALLRVGPLAEAAGVEIHLETDLGPAEFSALLENLPPGSFKVTYDTGNSAAVGYDPREEFACYGSRIGSVHIKDRTRGGGTVPLGTGNTDFGAVFEQLRAIRYGAGYVLQTARGAAGDELLHAHRDREFLVGWLARIDPGPTVDVG